MTRENLIAQEEKENEIYKPCFYCKKTLTCVIECVAKFGFNNIITAKFNDCITRKYTDEHWKNEFIANANKYNIPIRGISA